MQTTTELAERLIAARNGGAVVEAVPDSLVPADIAAVYALQDVIIGQLGPVGGWKVQAGVAEPVVSPIPADRYFDNGASINAGTRRFIIPEVEVAIKLGQDLPGDASLDQVASAIASLHPVLEMIANPFADRDAMANNVKLGDLQSNGAVVVGPALADGIKADLATLSVALVQDGQTVKTAETGASWDATLVALQWLARHAAARNLPLKAGQVIITGARALAPLDQAKTVEGRLGDWGTVNATLTY